MEINPKNRSNNYFMNQVKRLGAFLSAAPFHTSTVGLLGVVAGLRVVSNMSAENL